LPPPIPGGSFAPVQSFNPCRNEPAMNHGAYRYRYIYIYTYNVCSLYTKDTTYIYIHIIFGVARGARLPVDPRAPDGSMFNLATNLGKQAGVESMPMGWGNPRIKYDIRLQNMIQLPVIQNKTI
jgi:hypothetical protein